MIFNNFVERLSINLSTDLSIKTAYFTKVFFLMLICSVNSQAIPLPLKIESRTLLVSVAPIALIAKSLVGPQDQIETLIPAGSSPHDFQLRPSDLKRIAEADLIVWLGPEHEPMLAKTIAKALARDKSPAKVINVMELPGLSYIEYADHHAGDEHHQANLDPHIWLDPANALELSKQIQQVMGLQKETEKLAPLKKVARVSRNKDTNEGQASPANLLVYHDAYRYLHRYFGLEQKMVIQKSHNVSIGLKQLKTLRGVLNTNQQNAIRSCIVIDPYFQQSKLFKQLNSQHNPQQKLIEWVVIDPMASERVYVDYLDYFQEASTRYSHCLN